MSIFLAILTYFAYVFIVLMYGIKLAKYVRMPTHLRWELYPVIHEEKLSYGGSYLEERNWWDKARKKRPFKGFFSLLKDYFTLSDYARRNFLYWIGLYPWHIGFILIITFHILCFFGAILIKWGIDVSPKSTETLGALFYYLTLIAGLSSFVLGILGGIIVMLNRIFNRSLREFATRVNYFTYFFTIVVFFTGFYSWFFEDPYLTEYRHFWVGLISLDFRDVSLWTKIHIVVFDLFLIYLPFTRSLHYVTRFLAFFLIRWDDEPNLTGGKLEEKIRAQLERDVSWSAPHIGKGKKWRELARSNP
jgi:nitrate reductase gamma subunit